MDKPLGAAVNYLLTNEHGLSLLQCIYDYINSDAMTLSYQGKEIEEDIVVSNSRSQNTYSLAHNEYDAVLLTQIQQELVLLKHNAARNVRTSVSELDTFARRKYAYM